MIFYDTFQKCLQEALLAYANRFIFSKDWLESIPAGCLESGGPLWRHDLQNLSCREESKNGDKNRI